MALTGTKTFQNYIGGEWVGSASGETFESVSPATGDPIGVFPRSSADDVDRAVSAWRRLARTLVGLLPARLVSGIARIWR